MRQTQPVSSVLARRMRNAPLPSPGSSVPGKLDVVVGDLVGEAELRAVHDGEAAALGFDQGLALGEGGGGHEGEDGGEEVAHARGLYHARRGAAHESTTPP